MAKSKKKAAKRSEAPSESDLGRVLLLLENIQEQQVVLAEGQVAFREAIEQKLEDMEARLTRRIEVLEVVVREHSEQLRAIRVELDGVHREFHGIHRELDAIHQELDAIRQRLDRIEGRLDEMATRADLEALDRRVSKLEQLAGI